MPNDILSDAINAVCRGEELAEDEAARVLREVMEGRSSPEETAGLLIALRTRGETADEIAGLARTMREFAARVDAGGSAPLRQRPESQPPASGLQGMTPMP